MNTFARHITIKIKAIFFLLCIQGTLKSQRLDVADSNLPKIEFSTRLGLNSLSQFNIHGTYKLGLRTSLAFSVGYHYGSEIFPSENGLLCDEQTLLELYTKKGPRFQLGIRQFAHYKAPRKIRKRRKLGFFSLNLFYAYGRRENLIYDPGCYNRGSSFTPPDGYDFIHNDLGVVNYVDFRRENSVVSFYFGYGVGRRWREEKRVGRPPTYETSNIFFIDIGVNILLIQVVE